MMSPPPGPIACVCRGARAGARFGREGLARLVLALALLPVSASTLAEAPMQPVEERVPVPGAFVDDGGAPVRLESLRGRLVLLNFWATWCAPCVEELPAMNAAWAALEGEGVGMLAINAGEARETVEAFLERVPVDFPVALGDAARTLPDWSVRVLPTTLVLDASGRVVYEALGPRDWDAEALLDRVRALVAE